MALPFSKMRKFIIMYVSLLSKDVYAIGTEKPCIFIAGRGGVPPFAKSSAKIVIPWLHLDRDVFYAKKSYYIRTVRPDSKPFQNPR